MPLATETAYSFPENFIWGTATAAPQIEGGASADGRGPSIWDTFSAKPGSVYSGHTPEVACDHYHRYREDIALMASLGIKHYRFSFSWSRLLPHDNDKVNIAGISFYKNLLGVMKEYGITPWATMFHWDLPQYLEDKGGWANRMIVDAFELYAKVLVEHFGENIPYWFTLNEMPCFIGLGYGTGYHAPGRKLNPSELVQTYHHGLLAHGKAVQTIRTLAPEGTQIGLVHNAVHSVPVYETEEHIEATRLHFMENNGPIYDPLFKGCYPENMPLKPEIHDHDMDIISTPTDFLGVNIYFANFVQHCAKRGYEEVAIPQQYPKGDIEWLNITPQCIYWPVRFMSEDYGVKHIYVTENGACFDDVANEEGTFNDLHRREFLRNYLISLHRAVTDDLGVKGYFLWSFLDNFEWAEGYSKRFGIVHCDYQTMRRTPKLSAKWYAKVISENRVL
ncbi:MAG: GH1 family beta-glucosidase [Verrucomicrobiota bacterium]